MRSICRTALSLFIAWIGAPAAAQDWSGPYAGVHFGLGRGQDEVLEVNGPRAFYPDTDGVLGGVQIGWQRQFERFVAGAELELGYLGQEGSVSSTDASGTVATRAELGAYGTLSARAGYLLTPSLLAFGRAGLALAALEAQTDQTCPGSGGGCALTPSRASTRDHAWAFVFGGGIETAVTERWRARLEYQYFDFRRELALPASGSGPGWNHELDLHAVKFGINYRF